ncbi:MAG: hypothetical protein H6732_04920 [Alphaproteobacteria bacterium]|nr:hypothetical protein [Alphaproteobacteria bacterium]
MVRPLLPALLLACAPASPPATDTDADSDVVDTTPVDTAPPLDPAWTCADDHEVCDGLCRPVRFDPQACGDCDTTCGDSEVCDEGTCVPRPVATTCDEATRALVLAPATADAPSVELACSLTLDPGDVVTKKVHLRGTEASGVTLDCQGATLRKTLGAGGSDMVWIVSRKVDDTTWARPSDVVVRDCRIEGSVRVQGQGANGEAEDVRVDSLTLGHRERAQAAAPTRVLLERLTVVADGRIPVYLAPGTTAVTLRDSTFGGRVVSTVVYLDAESAHHQVVGNTFDAQMEGSPLPREVLAVDGSADNVIAGNTFAQPRNGGVFVYRNCGEGGTVRHQEPRRNLITGNTFAHPSGALLPTIWVGSRKSSGIVPGFCPLDDGYPFGSSVSDEDMAGHTVVTGNRFTGEPPATPVSIRVDPAVDEDNLSDAAEAPVSRCAVFRDGAAPRVVDEGTEVGDRVCREGLLTRAP